MTLRVRTLHSADFDIHVEAVDLAMSSYAPTVTGYVSKVTAFYEKLGIRSAIWATPVTQPLRCIEYGKDREYELEVSVPRIVAYVDAGIWSDYLHGQRDSFDYSKTPQQFDDTSVIIPTPITRGEVKVIRRYRRLIGAMYGPESFEIVEERFL